MDTNGLGEELPTARADPELRREKTGIRLDVSVVPPKVTIDVNTSGSARSPASAAVTMLLVVTGACIPAALLGVIGWLVQVRGMPLAGAVLGLFIALFVTLMIVAFRTREDHIQPDAHGTAVIAKPGDTLAANGSARANGRKAGQGGTVTKEIPAPAPREGRGRAASVNPPGR